jgi:hypothetical protein
MDIPVLSPVAVSANNVTDVVTTLQGIVSDLVTQVNQLTNTPVLPSMPFIPSNPPRALSPGRKSGV